jgi:hypothetical protein
MSSIPCNVAWHGAALIKPKDKKCKEHCAINQEIVREDAMGWRKYSSTIRDFGDGWR